MDVKDINLNEYEVDECLDNGKITNDEWKDSSIRKYIIFRKMSYVGRCEAYSNYEFLAFHTAEQRDEFLKNNEQLVKDYLMIE